MSQNVQVHDKEFELFIAHEEIQTRLKALAIEISTVYNNQPFTLLPVLNGSFIVTADLCMHLNSNVKIDFIKWNSYQGMESSGKIEVNIGLKENLEGKDILIVEDIIDTGYSISQLYEYLMTQNPRSLRIFTLLHKPDAQKHPVDINFLGFSIPNDFVVGYGLDYNEMGRNLKDIYKLKI